MSNQAAINFITQVAKSFSAFLSLCYISADNQLMKFPGVCLNQRRVLQAIASNSFVKILKGRQFGVSTIIALYFLWKIIFKAHTKVLVVAHHEDSVAELFKIYKVAFQNLPQLIRPEIVASNTSYFELANGSCIRVVTANSEAVRSSHWDYVHASEMSRWRDMHASIAAIFQACSGSYPVILGETTAFGLNAFHDWWEDDNNGFLPIFLSYVDHEAYNKDHPLGPFTAAEQEYINKYNLKPTKANWFQWALRIKCGNNWDNFNQEYPITEEVAFLSTGSPYFRGIIPPPPFLWEDGLDIFLEPEPYHAYTLGLDTASGSPSEDSDRSSGVVLDITNKQKPLLAATFAARITLTDFSNFSYQLANKYNRALVVPETNSYGKAVLEHFVNAGYPYIYHYIKPDTIQNRMSKILGFWTGEASRNRLLTRLQQYIPLMDIPCNRLVYELTKFSYNKEGKPEASPGEHDDLVIAFGLALIGLDLADQHLLDVKKMHKPEGLHERLKFKMQTHLDPDSVPPGFFNDENIVNHDYSIRPMFSMDSDIDALSL